MLQKLGFLPGFNKQVTSTGAESQWTGGQNVRFRYGTPEKLGGWSQLGESKLTGVARGLHHFVNSASTKFAAIGTNRILYAYSGVCFMTYILWLIHQAQLLLIVLAPVMDHQLLQ